MAKDATPDKIELKNDNFANEKHADIVDLLLDKWDASTSMTQIGEESDDHHRATIQKVYKRYFGVPESLFNDGIDDRRTIDQIKAHHGTFKDYEVARGNGDLDVANTPGVEWVEGMEPEGYESGEEENSESDISDREMEMFQEGVRKGRSDGFAEGWDRALEQVDRLGLENVPRMTDEQESN